jgi:CRP-like cAMP-binding protein
VISYNHVLLAHAQITAACNALHPVEARLCRWILQAYDRNSSDVIALTQEFLSEMLAVRRSSVSDVARKLQAAGLIRYSRGVIEIANRRALEMASCECYADAVKKSAKILPWRSNSNP